MAIPDPVLGAILAKLTYILTLGLTSPSSPLRFPIFMLMPCYISLLYKHPSKSALSHPFFMSLSGATVFNTLLSYADAILLGQWCCDARGPTSSRGGQQPVTASSDDESTKKDTGIRVKGQSSVVERLCWATGQAWDNRLLATPWQVANVPPFSRQHRKWVPTKAEFLRKNTMVCVLCLVLLDAVPLLAGPPEKNAVLFGEPRVGLFSRLNDVNAQELAIRLVSAAMFYGMGLVMMRAFHSGIAVITVGLGISEVERWRPPFGQPLDAWSLRQFWGSFWHQNLRQNLSSPARYVTYSVLRLTKGGLLGRYLFIFLTFWLSGVVHLCGDLAAGLPWEESGAMWFFCVQAFGIALEDGVQAAYRAIIGSGDGNANADNKADAVNKEKGKARPSAWKCVIGYIWVACWMAWSVPVYVYPAARRSRGEGLLPVSLIKMF
ncbi:MAG: hypothetical protein Q9191_007170 [Dirinaria sp. TL-2023a]